MADLIQLDAAARLVGKSEVTIRRAVKAGKVAARREKTLTGFIYMVDPMEVEAVFGARSRRAPRVLEDAPTPKREPVVDEVTEVADVDVPSHTVPSKGRMRVAVSTETGHPSEYWAKRAEAYEEKYTKEVQKNGELREELGLWRGRAENAQALLMRLLPAPSTVEVGGGNSTPPASKPLSPEAKAEAVKTRKLTFAGMIIVTAAPILLIVGAVLLYLIRNQ